MIHQYKNNGYNIVLDVNSGSVHVTDELMYDAIEAGEKFIGEMDAPSPLSNNVKEKIHEALGGRYSKEEIEEALEDLQELVNAQELYTPDSYEPYIRDFKARKTVVKALCLHIAHDCNLACKYCFAEEGEYHGRRALMSYEVGKAALDFLVASSGNRRNLEVDFFWRRAFDELAGGKKAGAVWQEPGGAKSKELPFYHYHQWDAVKPGGNGILQPGNEQCGFVSGWPEGCE